MSNEAYHIPVLLRECVESLVVNPDGVYVDVTFGGGGHSREILKKLSPSGRLFAFDQDQQAAANVPNDPRFVLINQNFAYLKNYLRMYRVEAVDGLLADLGVSSHQFDTPDRGFSLRFEGPLDMRMNQQSELTAARVVNTYELDDLKRVLKVYGELEGAGRLASELVKKRVEKPFERIEDLKNALDRFAPRHKWHQFYAKVFQALRIEVNGEMKVLETMLSQAIELLKPNGRLVVISYHSLEDRMVKNFVKAGNPQGDLQKDFYGNVLRPLDAVGKQPQVPTDEEIEVNNRARSAKLRIAAKRP
ncbi:MAG TPA: 16S rRNA (cytosine(1402)-N(4))-methyltransferase RsmH [Luteibaculaceae bacterium]|nr:16S rRNA (cytosine(1402)-N(4))-methyltransferase RsmH [Luteibaculaceae bacterium]